MNLFSILEDGATRWPEDIAVVHDGRSFRYSDLHDAAQSLALKLDEAGIEAGDKVGVMLPNSLEYVVAFFAVMRAGGIVVSISPALKSSEVGTLAVETALDAFCFSAHFSSLIPEGNERTLTEASISAGRRPLCI